MGVRSRRLLNRLRLAADIRITRQQQDVALALVIALGMIMFDVFVQRPPQGALAQEDHLGQALLLHRPDPALRIGIQVRTAGRQRERARSDPTQSWRGMTECISCPDPAGDSDSPARCRIPPWSGSGPFASFTAHPVNGCSGDIHPAAFKMHEKQHVVSRQPAQRQHLRREKSVPASNARWVRMKKAGHVVVRLRTGAGGRA